jgi:hypothetical protein
MTSATWSDRRAVVVGLVLFLLAATLRVALLHTARFGGDEALFFRLGMDIVEGKSFPLLGTQITDGAARLPGPTFLYLMALPLLVWRAPEAQYLFTELLGAATVVVLWQALRRPCGERAAFFTGLTFALSPWAALYADRTWNPNVLPFFVVVGVAAGLRLREAPGSRAALVFWPTLALLPHLHLSAPVAWAGLLALVGVGTLRQAATATARRWHVVGLALALLCYAPLLVHELQTGFGNTRQIVAETVGRQGGERHPWGFVWVPVYALRLLTTDVSYHELSGYWGGPDELRCLHSLWWGTDARPHHPLRLLGLLCSVVVSVGAWGGAIAVARRDALARVVVGAAVVAVVANTALMGLAAKQVFGHYVIALLPFLLLLLAVALQQAHGRLRLVLQVCVVVAALVGVEATLSVSRRVDARIGLEVHRRAGAVIAADADAAGLPQSEPIALFFVGLRSSHYDWHVFGTRALSLPWHFDQRARRRRYALTPPQAPAPRGAVGSAVDVGHALLWRLR